jgi:hypothetical protein
MMMRDKDCSEDISCENRPRYKTLDKMMCQRTRNVQRKEFFKRYVCKVQWGGVLKK